MRDHGRPLPCRRSCGRPRAPWSWAISRVSVTGISIDSRTLGVGEAFFAIRGHRVDGHDFVGEAAARGAACLVVHSVPGSRAGWRAARARRGHHPGARALGRAGIGRKFASRVVAITGSNGKTTTKEMVGGHARHAVAGAQVPRGASTTSGACRSRCSGWAPSTRRWCVELGTNQPGEIAYLAGLTAPTVGVVTTVAAVHTEFLGSLTGVREEKAALVRALGPEGWAVLNADDPHVAGMARDTIARVMTFGAAPAAAVRAVGDVVDVRGLAVHGRSRRSARPVELRLRRWPQRHQRPGRGCRRARRSAWACPRSPVAWRPLADQGPLRVATGRRRAASSTTRTTRIPRRSRRRSRPARPPRRVAAWSSCSVTCSSWAAMAEEAHRGVGRQVASLGPACSWRWGRRCEPRWRRRARPDSTEAYHAATFEDAVAHLLKRLAAGDLVLVKGSRGMRMERIADAPGARA